MSRPQGHVYVISGFFFVYYAAAAALLPNFPLIFENAGLGGSEIGLLLALPPAIGVVAAPTLSLLADLTGRGRVILGVGIAGAGFAAIGLGVFTAFVAFVGVMLVFAVSIAPVVPFVDAAAVAATRAGGSYGNLRIWGAVGWGLAAPIVGWGVDRTGLGLAPTVFAVGMAILFVLSRRMPISVEKTSRLSDVRQALASSKGWAALLAGAFLIGAASGTIGFLFVLLRDLGASAMTMGLALAIATISELVGFTMANRVVQRIGVGGTIMLGCVGAAIRLVVSGVAPSVEVVLAAQLLHGVSFALPWAAGVMGAARLSPSGLGTTGQGAFSAVALGLGPTVGVISAGLLVDAGTTASMMGAMGGLLAVGTLPASFALLRMPTS